MKPTKTKAPTGADFGDWQSRMRSALFDAVGEHDIRDIMSALVARAKKGDMAAAKLVLTYAVGSPIVKAQNAFIATSCNGPVLVADVTDDGPTLAPPVASLPGTQERLDDMARRAAEGRPIFNPRDNQRDAS